MNSLPKTVTRQRRGCDLIPGAALDVVFMCLPVRVHHNSEFRQNGWTDRGGLARMLPLTCYYTVLQLARKFEISKIRVGTSLWKFVLNSAGLLVIFRHGTSMVASVVNLVRQR